MATPQQATNIVEWSYKISHIPPIFCCCSAAETELGTLLVNNKEGKTIHLILEEIGHPQPTTSIHGDNFMVTEIANDTVKKQYSQSMEMVYF